MQWCRVRPVRQPTRLRRQYMDYVIHILYGTESLLDNPKHAHECSETQSIRGGEVLESSLEKRLAAYTLEATSGLAALSAPAQGAIVYTSAKEFGEAQLGPAVTILIRNQRRAQAVRSSWAKNIWYLALPAALNTGRASVQLNEATVDPLARTIAYPHIRHRR